MHLPNQFDYSKPGEGCLRNLIIIVVIYILVWIKNDFIGHGVFGYTGHRGYTPTKNAKFILDGAEYQSISNFDIDYYRNNKGTLDEDIDYVYVGYIKKRTTFKFLLNEELEGYLIPIGTDIYYTDYYYGEAEYRLFLNVNDNMVPFYNLQFGSASSLYEKYGE